MGPIWVIIINHSLFLRINEQACLGKENDLFESNTYSTMRVWVGVEFTGKAK